MKCHFIAMPRQLRIQYPGALYHITARGDRREDIVHDDGGKRGQRRVQLLDKTT